ncbi:phytoene/squalene synthase family protein [Amorphus orientalis]|uniref:Phytoene synthase n=1 Tax=Amorphus orientalis TaxID=649198 RepID=A0AAE3VMY7_9HYPH|nr:phytoene/squalene synthase family protein [Amorphus orientalis]MDQ0315489.1 phytoene synthase [Amorphus orientalis]
MQRPSAEKAADIAACRATIKGGSKSFFAASLLLPGRVRDPAYALYAFCRLSDDAVDVAGGRTATIARLRDRLERAYAGNPVPDPVDRALARTVDSFAIPIELPMALIEGLAWDAEGRRYETLADLSAYAARVAGSVGAMMALLMGARSPEQISRACDLGIAMQFTNIARDVGEDARNGRIYLPTAWLDEAGIDRDRLLRGDPSCARRLQGPLQHLLSAADDLYARADAGIARLPLDCQPGIRAARGLYQEIGRELERRGLDPLAGRAVVSNARKGRLLVTSLAGMGGRTTVAGAPALAEAGFLVDAVRPLGPSPAAVPPWWDFGARISATIDLFDRLERRERVRRAVGES